MIESTAAICHQNSAKKKKKKSLKLGSFSQGEIGSVPFFFCKKLYLSQAGHKRNDPSLLPQIPFESAAAPMTNSSGSEGLASDL